MKRFLKLFSVVILTVLWSSTFAQYCTPAYSSGCTYGDGLTLFQLGPINQTIPCSGTPAYYHDYTAQSAPITAGVPASVTMKAGYSSTYVDIWIDYNNNNAFESTEVVVNDFVCAASGTNYTTTFTVPVTVLNGAHRLRYRTNWLSGPTDPCTSSSYGNAADFTINLTGGMAAPVTVTIGTGTVTTGYPYSTYWHDGRSQYMITAAEIIAAGGQPGNIGNLQFNVSGYNTSLQTMNGYNIRMQNTTATSLTGFVETGWTTVYSGTELITANGWKDKVFQTPFMWNGTSNLLIEVCFDNTAYTSYSYVYATAGAAGMVYYRYTDGATGCALTGPSTSVNRPNMKFTITPISYTIVTGTVTNANTGLPIVGAKIMCGDSVAYSEAGGTYTMQVIPGNKVFDCTKAGFDQATASANVSGLNFTQNFALLENTPAPGAVLAALNTAQNAVNINWGLPMSSYEIIYDDGGAENYTSWNVAGNINALKFTPLNQYPIHIEGGSVYVGDGSYPSGANLQAFTMAAYDDDGALGYPNTLLGEVEVTPTAYGWVEFSFASPITLTSGSFYLGMVQGGNYPNCLAIGIDETNPSMRSYSKNVTNNAPWVPAGYNDFMIRAIVHGSGGPLDLATTAAPTVIEKTRINAATKFLHQPKPASGPEGDALYKPVGNGDAPEALLGYQVWRLKQGEETNQAVWTSVSTPTGTSTVDNSWPSLPNGPYRWAVKAKYTGNRWSEPTFSNIIGKGWVSNVTFHITLSSPTASPENVYITMESTTTDSAYWGMTSNTGALNFPHVWCGNYDITVAKFGYETYTANVDIYNASYTFDILLMEMTYAPYNLFVDDRTLIAVWNAPNPQIALFEERWNGGWGANAWVVNGGNWGIAAGTGSPAPSAQFNWSPQVTNYEQSITSKDIVGQGSPAMRLKYDLFLSNFGTTNENQMAVEIWDGTAWNRLANYSNLGGDIPWTTYTQNITAYTWDTFKIRFVAYGVDSYDINNWNIDNILVVAALTDDKTRLGFDVYLDDIQIGFTTDTTYQIPQNLCVYGQTYTASVDAVYESGASERDYYTFTAHYLPPPTNLQGLAIQDAAYLTWEAPVMPNDLKIEDQSVRTSMPNANAEYSPMVTHYSGQTDAVWDVLFSFNCNAAAQPGIETNGTDIYTSTWNAGTFSKYAKSGATWSWVEDFTIAGASNVRDLAFDGTYFYGGAAATTIFKMDFVTKTLVASIPTSGVNVRHIAYDPTAPGFWTGNWSDMAQVSMTGATLTTATLALTGMYGSAYDPQSAGGPYLWIHDQGGSGVDIQQMLISTKALTGVVHAATDIPGFVSGSIAGGLAADNGNLEAGKFILLANVQQDPNLVGAYELAAGGGGGGGGTTPNTLMGYNIYRDGSLVAYVPKPALEYYDLYLNPAHYCYDITAVYDLEPYGFPAGSTDESLEEGPACIDINYGIPIPWTEDWATAAFTYNNWSFDPAQGHWRISNMVGNQVPAVEFNWAAPETDYSYALVSYALNASIYDCSDIYLDFDLKLDDRNSTSAEFLTVDVYWDGNWHKVAEYKNEASFDWDTKHIDITSTAGKALKVRFVAHGDNTADILGWFIDNISVYPKAHPASNLDATSSYPANGDANIVLSWNAPECITGPSGVLKMMKQWDGDPNSNVNGYYQSYGSAYGVVYDLTAYPDATLSKIDYHHASWGTTGTWQYNIHIVDWTTYTEIAMLGPLTTTGNDIWETNIPLGDIMGYGGGMIGIMLEPLSNSSTDAYPCFSADNDGPQGASVFGTLPDFAGFAPSAIGDFYQSLYIYTAFDKKSLVEPRQITVSELNAMANTRKPVPVIDLKTLSTSMDVITLPQDANRGYIGYNIYKDGVMLNTALVTDTTYTDLWTGGVQCYTVKAVHEGFFGNIESDPTDEVCMDLTGIKDPVAQNLSVFPNPAKEFVNVKTNKDIRKIEMVNYLGQSVYTQTVEGEATFTISTVSFESGVYFIRFTDKTGNVTNERVTITE